MSDLRPGVEKKIFKEIMHFLYMTYLDTPYTRTFDRRDMAEILPIRRKTNQEPLLVVKITILVDPKASLVIITTYLVCLCYVQKEFKS